MEKVQTGRVIEFYSNSCLVDTNDLKIQCSILGKQDIVVGDSVNLEYQNKNDPRSALITSRIERASELKKKSIRGSKVIAANITHVGILLVQNPTTSTEFIDKWIASSKASNIEPFIINNKIDIDMPSAYLEKVEIYKNIDIEIFNISAKENTGLIDLTDYLQNKCTIFVGNSGAGKSTLTSKLTGVDIKTKALSNNQGRHTTSISSLYMLPENLEIIDSPGVRDVPIEGLTKEEIVNGFFEIHEASKLCKFSNCNHRGDEGCNVIPMINDGEISKSRYNNFIKFLEQIPD
jgi:ribosome biogenesis GTPase